MHLIQVYCNKTHLVIFFQTVIEVTLYLHEAIRKLLLTFLNSYSSIVFVRNLNLNSRSRPTKLDVVCHSDTNDTALNFELLPNNFTSYCVIFATKTPIIYLPDISRMENYKITINF